MSRPPSRKRSRTVAKYSREKSADAPTTHGFDGWDTTTSKLRDAARAGAPSARRRRRASTRGSWSIAASKSAAPSSTAGSSSAASIRAPPPRGARAPRCRSPSRRAARSRAAAPVDGGEQAREHLAREIAARHEVLVAVGDARGERGAHEDGALRLAVHAQAIERALARRRRGRGRRPSRPGRRGSKGRGSR